MRDQSLTLRQMQAELVEARLRLKNKSYSVSNSPDKEVNYWEKRILDHLKEQRQNNG